MVLTGQLTIANEPDDIQILIMGDEFSMTDQWQGTQYRQQKSWVTAADERLREHGILPRWSNESKAGGTLQHAASVLDWRLRQRQPHVVVIVLGANDTRYGYRTDFMAKHLRIIAARALKHAVKVVIVYNRLPANMTRMAADKVATDLRTAAADAGLELMVLKADEAVATQPVGYNDWARVTAANQTNLLNLIWDSLLAAVKPTDVPTNTIVKQPANTPEQLANKVPNDDDITTSSADKSVVPKPFELNESEVVDTIHAQED